MEKEWHLHSSRDILGYRILLATIWLPAHAPSGSSSKLTKRIVDAAFPQASRYFACDAELKGFAVRVAPSGTKTYIVRYRPRGLGQAAPRRFVVLGRHGP